MDYTAPNFTDNAGPPYLGPSTLNPLVQALADAASHHKRVADPTALPPAAAANKNWLVFTDSGGVYLSDGSAWTLVAGTEPARKVGTAGQPAFAGTWANGTGSTARQPLHFWKEAGVVHIRGAVAGGSTTTIFTLPAGYRPTSMAEAGLTYWNGTAVVEGYCRVLADGSVQVFNSAEAAATGISETYIVMDFRVDV